MTRWTSNEDKLIRDLYGSHGGQHIADLVGKTKGAVCARAKRLKVKNNGVITGDIVGKSIGKLTVISLSDKNTGHGSWYWCDCECGNRKEIRRDTLIGSSIKSCGCLRPVKWTNRLRPEEIAFIKENYDRMTARELALSLGRDAEELARKIVKLNLKKRIIEDLPVGYRRDMLTVVEQLGSMKLSNEKCRAYRVLCDCGNTKVVKKSFLVHSEHFRSCGCSRYKNHIRGNPSLVSFTAMFYNYKSGARHRGHEFALTVQDFVLLIRQNCGYCGAEGRDFNAYINKDGSLSKSSNVTQQRADQCWIKINGIDRKDNSIGYRTDNCIPCCTKCNLAKRDMSPKDFVDHAMKIASHQAQLAVKE